MPRGFRTDRAVTNLLYANRIFLDSRSFVSLGSQPHLVLYGIDIVEQRKRLYLRDLGKCAECESTTEDWEWDHIQGGNVGRCDCLHNAQTLCRQCHYFKTRESEHH